MVAGEERLVAEVRRGLLALLVLAVIASRGEAHGYAIRKIIGSSLGWEPSESTLYDVLRRLERQGMTVSYWAEGRLSGAARKYYRITSLGYKALEKGVSELRSFHEAIESVLEG